MLRGGLITWKQPHKEVQTPPRPLFYATEEVADLFKVNVKTIREIIKSKRLQAVRFGQEYRITDEQIR
jgi:excisionase family DNA binding protein